MKTVYVDMDGVLSDFHRRWFEKFGWTPKERFSKTDWKQFIADDEFSTLDEFPGYPELMAYLESLRSRKGVRLMILTSSGGFEHHGEVQLQKMQWLDRKKNFLQPIVVPGRRHKKHYANTEAFLLDDHEENCAEFFSAGGHSHVYTNPKDGIAAIESFLSAE